MTARTRPGRLAWLIPTLFGALVLTVDGLAKCALSGEPALWAVGAAETACGLAICTRRLRSWGAIVAIGWLLTAALLGRPVAGIRSPAVDLYLAAFAAAAAWYWSSGSGPRETVRVCAGLICGVALVYALASLTLLGMGIGEVGTLPRTPHSTAAISGT